MNWQRTIVGAILLLLGACRARASEISPDDREFFEKKVRPVLVEHCEKCHGAEQAKGGLRLHAKAGWLEGGDSGPAIIPGNPDESLLIQAVRYGGDYEMPPEGRLPPTIVRDLEEWVRRGAPDPRTGAVTLAKPRGIDLELGRQHWAYRPLAVTVPPAVRDEVWPVHAIDRFVLEQLEERGSQTAAGAPRDVLVRRLYFDLTGLPPTPDDMAEFVSDRDERAYERLVDRLLASPHFGERWGRHWLDVARYAESLTLRGFVFHDAWRYRDYVIDSLNSDRPYDQFVQAQIAGDLMPAESLEEQQANRIATTYLMLGNTNLEEQDKTQLEMDFIDEQLDTIGKGLLAQTLGCARCHDHKFDPISMQDYYGLAGIFKNVQALEHANVSKWVEVPLPLSPVVAREYQRRDEAVARLQAKIQQLKAAAGAGGGPDDARRQVVPIRELPGVVVDDTQARRVGEWKESQSVRGYVGSGYLHDLATGSGQKSLTFTAELPRDGRYEVRFAYTPGTNRAPRATVTVFSADGEKAIQLDQREPPDIEGLFVSLGQFAFERAGQSFVIVTNEDAGGHVVADAVQFLPLDESVAAIGVRAGTANAIPESSSREKSPKERSPRDESVRQALAELKRHEAELKRLNQSLPARPVSMSVREMPTVGDIRIHVRGSVHNLGPAAPRGFLAVCRLEGAAAPPANQSGRRELAQWLTDPRHPLTARVMTNRIWYWLLGQGLVRTVDNFGTTGEPPSHPELLDFLTERFIASGWSVKELVRDIVLSRTYRQDSQARTMPSDPDNRWLSRHARRRLDAEELRDAMLLVSGQLQSQMGGPTYPRQLASDYGFQHRDTRRSVYSPVFR
ncbi:MAG: DUF1549 domain-containing protein, partial [Pirellulaceae bacterium]